MDYTDSGKFEIVMEEDLKIPTPDELAEVHLKAMDAQVKASLKYIVDSMKDQFANNQVMTIKTFGHPDKVIQEVQKKLLERGWQSKAIHGVGLEIRPISKR